VALVVEIACCTKQQFLVCEKNKDGEDRELNTVCGEKGLQFKY